MTTFQELDVRCAVCSSKQRVIELTGAGAFGPPDLDLGSGYPRGLNNVGQIVGADASHAVLWQRSTS